MMLDVLAKVRKYSSDTSFLTRFLAEYKWMEKIQVVGRLYREQLSLIRFRVFLQMKN